MVFRELPNDGDWRAAREGFDEQMLPKRYQEALAAFERKMRGGLPAKPRRIELELGSETEAYYPNYDAMKPEGMVGTVLMALLMWIFGGGLVSVVGVMGLFVLPDPLVLPVMIGAMLLGFGGVGAIAIRWVVNTWRHNRVKKAAPGLIAYGTFLLTDGIIRRDPSGVCFFPRACVQEVEVERTAASSSSAGGVTTSQRPETRVYFKYADAFSESKRTELLGGSFAGHDDPEPARRLRAWIGQTVDDSQSRSFGHTALAELAREDFASSWRSFRRRRRGAYIALIGPWLLFIGGTILGHLIGNAQLDDAFGLGVVPVVVLLALPGVVGWGLYRAARCPRCGKSPRQPLAGTDVTRCLSCGLPIFTKARMPTSVDEAGSGAK